MTRYAIHVAHVPGDVHWQTLKEAIESVIYGLKACGHEARFGVDPATCDRIILFNAHTLHPQVALAPDTILFNSEQIANNGRAIDLVRQAVYHERLRRHVVWDYSTENVERLHVLGAERVAVCRLGYWPKLERISLRPVEPVDVLFFGSLNERRQKIMRELHKRGLHARAIFGVYGDDRDDWIAQSKVVVNAHFFPEPIWEIFRCSYLLANKKCVVSESGGTDEELEALAERTTAYVPYDKIVDRCAELVNNADERRAIAARGYELFSQRDQGEYVRAALEETATMETGRN